MGKKKDALLKAAKELFGEYGYAETTFKKISERAGVAPGLLAHHFGCKEKLFLASGLDVLKNFQQLLENSIMNTQNGYAGVMAFCTAYLSFSIDSSSNWLVLVRCSPYSDMKISSNQAMMEVKFTIIHKILEKQLSRGLEDGSISCNDHLSTAQVIMALLVGANRTRVLTPYAPENLYENVLSFIGNAIRK